MTRYEERLENDEAEIRRRVLAVGDRVNTAFKDSVHAVMTGDRDLSSQVILGDLPINREVRRIDHLCHTFVARHLPSAGHLRFVSSVLRLDVALERIGDYAVTIAREQVQLSKPPPPRLVHDLDLLADQSRVMLSQALKALEEGNAELARGTRAMATQVERTFHRIFLDLIAEGERNGHSIRDLFALLVMFNRIGRVADQAKNICEETVFIGTGEAKEPKVYRILFIDQRNDMLSQLARSYAARAFPESGRFDSAGWEPAESLDPRFAAYTERKGIEIDDAHPKALSGMSDSLADYHVIVSLQGDAYERLEEVPFHTVLLHWEVGEIADGLDQQRTEALLEQSLERIRAETTTLMETLRGEGAS